MDLWIYMDGPMDIYRSGYGYIEPKHPRSACSPKIYTFRGVSVLGGSSRDGHMERDEPGHPFVQPQALLYPNHHLPHPVTPTKGGPGRCYLGPLGGAGLEGRVVGGV